MQNQKEKRQLCRQPRPIPHTLGPDVSSRRASFIMAAGKKWVNGTDVKYLFLDGAESQRAIVRKAFKEWKDLGIGISFTEVQDIQACMVRIGFDHTDGSWSYVGRDILSIEKPKPTMNFGWDLDKDDYGYTTALHEIGHTLGFQHEHQSPFAGIQWNIDAVYREFSGTPNFWHKREIDENILNKIRPDQVIGSDWDPTSIMQYEFGPGLVVAPVDYVNGIYPPGILSASDIKGVRSFYPTGVLVKNLQLLQSETINVKSAGQADFSFKAPVTRKYTFQTFGEMDTIMVVSEKGEEDVKHYLSGDDDSGLPRNTKIALPLVEGREYIVNIRILYSPGEESGGIIVY